MTFVDRKSTSKSTHYSPKSSNPANFEKTPIGIGDPSDGGSVSRSGAQEHRPVQGASGIRTAHRDPELQPHIHRPNSSHSPCHSWQKSRDFRLAGRDRAIGLIALSGSGIAMRRWSGSAPSYSPPIYTAL